MISSDDLLDSIKRARAAVATAEAEQRKLEGLLRDAKKAVALARKKAELAIEEALAERRQPSLFDAAPEPASAIPTASTTAMKPLGDASAWVDLVPPAVGLSEVPTWRSMRLDNTGWDEELDLYLWNSIRGYTYVDDLVGDLQRGEMFGLDENEIQPLYALVEQLTADDEKPIKFAQPTLPEPPVQKPRDAFPPDQAGYWEHLHQSPTRNAPADMDRRELIAGWRQRQRSGKDQPEWGMWSEFTVRLADGREVQVCYVPNTFADHLEFRGEATSETGYRSDFQQFGAKNRPQITLEAFALRRAEELAEERKPKLKKERKKKAEPAPKPEQPSLFKVGEALAAGALKIACPLCLAPEGEGCRTGSGSPKELCLARAYPKQPAAAPTTKLNGLDNFPDAVFDACFTRGISTVETLLEQLEEYRVRIGLEDLPLRNRLVTYFVAECEAKLKPAEYAAAAVADHVERGEKPAPEPDTTQKKPDTAPARKRTSSRSQLKAAREAAVASGKDTVKLVFKPTRKPKPARVPVPESIVRGTWGDVPNFPVLSAEHLATHGIKCVADLDARLSKLRQGRGKQGADRYQMLRELATPHTFTAGDALVDWEDSKKAPPAEEKKPAGKRRKAVAK